MTADVFSRFPQLQTGRLMLRDLSPDDAPHIFRIFSDEEVTRYYDLDTFSDASQAEELVDRFKRRFDNGIGLRWAIVECERPEVVVGTCGYNIWIQPSARAVIGYDLARPYWRRGIMTEALEAVIEFGFERMGLNRIEAVVFVENVASHRLLEKLRFEREGVLRDYEFLKGRFVDMVMYSLLRKTD